MTWDSATQASTRTTSVAMKIDLSVLGGTPSISDHDTGGSLGTGSRSVGAGGSGGSAGPATEGATSQAPSTTAAP
jgi:hypothetical protein